MYNYPMNKNARLRLLIAGILVVLLIAAGITYLFFSRRGNEGNEGETVPSGTVTLTPIEADASQPSDATDATAADGDYSSYPLNTPSECQAVIDAYAADHGIDPFSYPLEIVNLLNNNPEALDFVLHYPELTGTQDSPDFPGTINMTGLFSPVRVPEYYQFDTRWGYKTYAGNVMGITGSGPTALSMVASYLLGNSDMNPAWMAAFAENNGYTMDGGTNWSLMSDGAQGLGIDVTPITADQDRIERNLDVGNIIVCLMGPGDFTSSAQYILIVGYNEEGYEIRDPGSPSRTAVRWQFDTLAPQMSGCWIMRIL